MTNKLQQLSNFVVFETDQGKVNIDVFFYNDTLWLTLKNIALLFDTDKSGISRHLANIFNSGELDKNSTVAKIATVQKEGGRQVSRELDYHNLDTIISVGYRVNSQQATQFRICAH